MAQDEKFVYEDSSLLIKDEAVDAPVEETRLTDEVLQTYIEEKPDTALYPNSIQIPYDSIKQWKALEQYAYIKYLDSLLKNRKKTEIKNTPTRSPGFLNDILGSGIFSALLWILAICFVVFLIYRLFLADGVFRRRSKTLIKAEAEEPEEGLTAESDFDKLIRTALEQGNYRQAVRYQYLRTLHALAGRNFIELAPDKTNYQYVTELKNRDQQQAFAALTLNYEYVWYGEFNIDKPVYEKIENGFTSLNQKL